LHPQDQEEEKASRLCPKVGRSKAYKKVVREFWRLRQRDLERAQSAYDCVRAQLKRRETRVTKYCDWHMRECAEHIPFAPTTYQRVGLDGFHMDERPSDLVHALKHQLDIHLDVPPVGYVHNKQCTGGRGCLECRVILYAYRDQVKKSVRNAQKNKGVCEVRDRYLMDGVVRRQVSFHDGLFLVLEFNPQNTNDCSRRQCHVITLYRKS
jgi:hypothetical protein